MPNFAAIDLGSNAARLKIVESSSQLEMKTLETIRMPLRLGHDAFISGVISEDSIKRAIDVFSTFSRVLADYRVYMYRAVTTAAVRESENRELFVDRITRGTGIKLEIITGVEEAKLLMFALRDKIHLNEKIFHLEIGGGSIELGVFDSKNCELSSSIKLGAVKLHEMFLAGNSGNQQIKIMNEFIERILRNTVEEIRELRPLKMFVTGGNADTLARLRGEEKSFHGKNVPYISSKKLEEITEKLSRMSYDERIKFGLEKDRADVIIPASHLILFLQSRLGFDGIYVPGIDLRDGILRELILDYYEKELHILEESDVAIGSALRLGRKFRFDQEHALHVMNLSKKLFEELHDVHKLEKDALRYLQLAAILHDIGHAVNPSKHHRHSYYLIRNSELMGVSEDELEIIANIARYHRKSHPCSEHDTYQQLSKPEKILVTKLASILRIADSLDREHKLQVKDLSCKIKNGKLVIKLSTESDCILERWSLAERAKLFEETFGLKIELILE
ncbi:MAG: Ppx/GppA phosphatase family protein [Thermoplasmata archaeon]